MKRLFSVLLLSTCALFSMAQVDTEFWFAAPWMNSHHTGEADFHMILSAYDQDTKVTITQPAWQNRILVDTTILAHSYCDIIIGPRTDHKQYAEANLEAPYNKIAPRGLYITTDQPISAYYQITHANGEAYTLKGKNALGTEFVVMSQTNFANYANYNGYVSHNNSIQIVATENNTTVTITPSNPVIQDDGSASDTPITITLQRGETYAVKSASTAANKHLMGTRIVASKPIAVTTSDDSVDSGAGQDAVGEQIVPTDMAGTNYTVIPLTGTNSPNEYLYILALNANTTVTLIDDTNTETITLANAGEWQARKIKGVTYIEADNAIQVFQFTNRQGESGGTILPQMRCTGSKHVTYKRIPNSNLCYLNILTQTNNAALLTMNGNAIPFSVFKPVPGNPDWSYTSLDVTAKPADMPVEVEIQHGVFQLGVVDRASQPQGTLTYGFFSDYATTSPVYVTHEELNVDTAVTIDEGFPITLIASAADGVGQFTWYKDGQLIATGDTLVISAVALKDAGTYEVRAVSDICTVEYAVFNFHVIPAPVPPCPKVEMTYPEQICGEEKQLLFNLTITEGAFDKAELTFDTNAKQAGWRDTTFLFVKEQIGANLPANLYIQPEYNATLTLYPQGQNCDTITLPIRFSVLYPTSVFVQRWNDVLAVLNEKYNRGEGVDGYHFTAFQWYKDGQPIPGANTSYYYCGPTETLDFNAQYQVLLTREDGTIIITCPYTPVYKDVPDEPQPQK